VPSQEIGLDDLRRVNTREGLVELLRRKRVAFDTVLETLRFQEELEGLQVELGKMQRWVVARNGASPFCSRAAMPRARAAPYADSPNT
jgi:hypothetical protein